MICNTCGSEEFSVHDGIFYCTECSTQIEETRDEQTDEISFNRKTLLRSPSTKQSKSNKAQKYSDWITVEAYNYILFLQVDALMKLGVSPKLKPTVLHIWAKYLQKCEIAFRTDYQADENKPRLGPVPTERDLKVLYGVQMISGRKRRKSTSKSVTETETNENEESGSSEGPVHDSDSDASVSSTSSTSKPKYSSYARKLFRKGKINKKNKKFYVKKVCHMNLRKTLSFCYLGLLYTEDQLGLSDLIRFASEQRIPYINVIDKFPPTLNLQHTDTQTLLAYSVPDVLTVHKTAFEIIKFLNLPKIKPPSINVVASRLLKDLNLPDDLKPMIKVLFDDLNHRIKYNLRYSKYSATSLEEISADLLALSFILIALKMLFIFDGKYEIDHSKVMERLNEIYPDKKYFVFTEWRKQAMLKEYLFLTENPGYCTVNKLNSLCADRIISKYPHVCLKPPSSEDALSCCNKTVSKHEIKNILSSIICLPTTSEHPPSSFPMKSAVRDFENEWRMLPTFRETKNLDFTLLLKDFSSCSLSYNPLQISKEDHLSYHLLTSLYMPKSSDGSNIESESDLSQCVSIRTTRKYWFFNAHRNRVDNSVVSGNLDSNIPSVFKWLIKFISKCTFVGSLDLYLQVVEIEKLLFLGVRNFTPGMLHCS